MSNYIEAEYPFFHIPNSSEKYQKLIDLAKSIGKALNSCDSLQEIINLESGEKFIKVISFINPNDQYNLEFNGF